jgi:hypothetical protein
MAIYNQYRRQRLYRAELEGIARLLDWKGSRIRRITPPETPVAPIRALRAEWRILRLTFRRALADAPIVTPTDKQPAD